VTEVFKVHPQCMYCQAAGLVAQRKTNQLEQLKKRESADAHKN